MTLNIPTVGRFAACYRVHGVDHRSAFHSADQAARWLDDAEGQGALVGVGIWDSEVGTWMPANATGTWANRPAWRVWIEQPPHGDGWIPVTVRLSYRQAHQLIDQLQLLTRIEHDPDGDD